MVPVLFEGLFLKLETVLNPELTILSKVVDMKEEVCGGVYKCKQSKKTAEK